MSDTKYLIELEPLFNEFNEKLEQKGFYSNSTISKDELKDIARQHFQKRIAEQYKNLGNSYFSKKQSRKASKMYQTAILLDPTNATYYSNLCGAFSNMLDFANAEEACQNGLKYAEAGSDLESKLWWRYSRIYKENGKFEEALQAINQSLAISPNNKDYNTLKKELESIIEK